MKVNKFFLTVVLGVCFFGGASFVYSYDSGIEAMESAQGVAWLGTCQEKVLGVELLCNRNWKQEIGRNSITFTISEDPAVLLTVVRSQEIYSGIEELTEEKLRKKGQYTQGFQMEKLDIGGCPALKIQGFTRDFEDIKLMDIYVYHDFRIYGFLFSVNPPDHWGRFSVLFSEMIKSIKFVDNQK